MQFGVLGTVEVRRDAAEPARRMPPAPRGGARGRPEPDAERDTAADGAVVAVGGPRVRALLAMLALEAGRVVPADRLVDGLYGED